MLDINAKPFEMCVKRVQITYCEDAHRCTKKQACLGEFRFMCDLELVFGLPCIFPMFKVVHTLIKYVQRRDVFIYGFIDAVKSVEGELHWLYVDPFYKYGDSTINKFIVICEHRNELLPFT